jgi:hypothetical protein
MMNDRFPLLLRRHLVERADERPAHGQLDTVLQRTAAARQRRPLLVRLRWLVDPAAPYANTRIRYAAAALALLVMTAMVAVLTGSGFGGRTVFEGRWTSIDITDRSTQTLIVEAGDSPAVHFEDDFSIDCQRRGETSTVYVADGIAETYGTRLIVQFPSGGCVTQLPPAQWFYDHDRATDTLVDHEGVRWSRLR